MAFWLGSSADGGQFASMGVPLWILSPCLSFGLAAPWRAESRFCLRDLWKVRMLVPLRPPRWLGLPKRSRFSASAPSLDGGVMEHRREAGLFKAAPDGSS